MRIEIFFCQHTMFIDVDDDDDDGTGVIMKIVDNE
jgi:hypothetical protein